MYSQEIIDKNFAETNWEQIAEETIEFIKQLKQTKSNVDKNSSNNFVSESLKEFYEPHKPGMTYWYLTKHGLGPGMLPKGVNVVDVYEPAGSWDTYVCLDKILSTKELKEYELQEKVPPIINECKKITEELVDPSNELIEEFENLLDYFGFEVVDKGHTFMGALHYQIKHPSIQVNSREEMIKVVTPLIDAIDKFSENTNTPITWNFGLDINKNITAGLDIDKTWIDESLNESMDSEIGNLSELVSSLHISDEDAKVIENYIQSAIDRIIRFVNKKYPEPITESMREVIDFQIKSPIPEGGDIKKFIDDMKEKYNLIADIDGDKLNLKGSKQNILFYLSYDYYKDSNLDDEELQKKFPQLSEQINESLLNEDYSYEIWFDGICELADDGFSSYDEACKAAEQEVESLLNNDNYQDKTISDFEIKIEGVNVK